MLRDELGDPARVGRELLLRGAPLALAHRAERRQGRVDHARAPRGARAPAVLSSTAVLRTPGSAASVASVELAREAQIRGEALEELLVAPRGADVDGGRGQGGARREGHVHGHRAALERGAHALLDLGLEPAPARPAGAP